MNPPADGVCGAEADASPALPGGNAGGSEIAESIFTAGGYCFRFNVSTSS